MTSDDTDDLLEAVVVCEGNIKDPKFINQFPSIVKKLKCIICEGRKNLQVRKVEPWNSVRVTMMIPPEAAVQLRRLAQQGSSSLRELGILSVQLEGDQVISLTLVGGNSEKQDASSKGECSHAGDARNPAGLLKSGGGAGGGGVVDHVSVYRHVPQPISLPTTSCSVVVQSGSQTSSASVSLPTPPTAATPKPGTSAYDLFGSKSEEFRSPNVVVPQTSRPVPFAVPQPPSSVSRSVGAACSPTISLRPNASPFPFASMEHAAHSISAARSSSTPVSIHQENSIKAPVEDVPCGSKSFPHPVGPPKPGPVSQFQVTYRPPSTTVTLPGSKIQSSLFTVDARAVAGDVSAPRLPSASGSVPSTSSGGHLLVARTEYPSSSSSVTVQAPSAISSPLLVNLLQTPEQPSKGGDDALSSGDAKKNKQQARVRRFKDKPAMMRAATATTSMSMTVSVPVSTAATNQMLRPEPSGVKPRPDLQGVVVKGMMGAQHFTADSSRSAAGGVQQVRKAAIPIRVQGSPYLSGIAVSPAPGKSYIVASPGSQSLSTPGALAASKSITARAPVPTFPSVPVGMKPNTVVRFSHAMGNPQRSEANLKLLSGGHATAVKAPATGYAVRHSVGQMVCVGTGPSPTSTPMSLPQKQQILASPGKCDVRTGTMAPPVAVGVGTFVSGGVLVREFPPNRPPPPYPGPPAESKTTVASRPASVSGGDSSSTLSTSAPTASSNPMTQASPVRASPSPPQLTSTGKRRQFLINPLTGLLEPLPTDSESSDEGMESDAGDDLKGFPLNEVDDDDDDDDGDRDDSDKASENGSGDVVKEKVHDEDSSGLISARGGGRGGNRRRAGSTSLRGRGEPSTRKTAVYRRDRRSNQVLPVPVADKIRLRFKLGRGAANAVTRGGMATSSVLVSTPSSVPPSSSVVASRPVYKLDAYSKNATSVDVGCDALVSAGSSSFTSVSTQSGGPSNFPPSSSMANRGTTSTPSTSIATNTGLITSSMRMEPRVPPLHISLKKGRTVLGKEGDQGKDVLDAKTLDVLSTSTVSSSTGIPTRVYAGGSETLYCASPMVGGYVRVPVSDANKLRRGKPARGRLKNDPVPSTSTSMRPYALGVGRGGAMSRTTNPAGVGVGSRTLVMNDSVLVAEKSAIGRGLGRGELHRVKVVGVRPPPGYISTASSLSLPSASPSVEMTSEALAVSVGVGNRSVRDGNDGNPLGRSVPEPPIQKWGTMKTGTATYGSKVSLPAPVRTMRTSAASASVGTSLSTPDSITMAEALKPPSVVTTLSSDGSGGLIRYEVPAGKTYNFFSSSIAASSAFSTSSASASTSTAGSSQTGELVFAVSTPTSTPLPHVVRRVEVNGPVVAASTVVTEQARSMSGSDERHGFQGVTAVAVSVSVGAPSATASSTQVIATTAVSSSSSSGRTEANAEVPGARLNPVLQHFDQSIAAVPTSAVPISFAASIAVSASVAPSSASMATSTTSSSSSPTVSFVEVKRSDLPVQENPYVITEPLPLLVVSAGSDDGIVAVATSTPSSSSPTTAATSSASTSTSRSKSNLGIASDSAPRLPSPFAVDHGGGSRPEARPVIPAIQVGGSQAPINPHQQQSSALGCSSARSPSSSPSSSTTQLESPRYASLMSSPTQLKQESAGGGSYSFHPPSESTVKFESMAVAVTVSERGTCETVLKTEDFSGDELCPPRHPRVEWLKAGGEASSDPSFPSTSSSSSSTTASHCHASAAVPRTTAAMPTDLQCDLTQRPTSEPAKINDQVPSSVRIGPARELLGSPCGVNDDSGIESMDTQSDKGEALSESPNRRDENPNVKPEPSLDVKSSPTMKGEKSPNDEDRGPGGGGFDTDLNNAAKFGSTSSTIQASPVSKIIPSGQALQKLSGEALLGLAVGSPLNLPAGTKMVPVRVVPLSKSSSGETAYLERNAESSQFLKSSQNQVAIMTSPVKFLVSKVASTSSSSSPKNAVSAAAAVTDVADATTPLPSRCDLSSSTKVETPTKPSRNALVEKTPSPTSARQPPNSTKPINGSDAAVKENCSENGELPRIPISVDHNYVLSKSEMEETKRKSNLDQLTIEIPSAASAAEEDKRMATRSSTRSASRLNSPQSRDDACTPSPCSTSSSKSSSTKQNYSNLNASTRGKRVGARNRNASGDSNASLNSTSSLDDNKKGVGKRNWSPSREDDSKCSSPVGQEPGPRPGKRRCSENATELIKACMGVEENPGGKKPCLTLPTLGVVPAEEPKKVVKEDENLSKKVGAGRKAKDSDGKVVPKVAAPNRVSKRVTDEKSQPVLKTISRSGRVSRPRTPDDEGLRPSSRNNHTGEGLVKRSIRPIRAAGAQNRKASASLLADTNCGGNGSGIPISCQPGGDSVPPNESSNDSKAGTNVANTRKRKGRSSGDGKQPPPQQVVTKRRRAAKDGAK